MIPRPFNSSSWISAVVCAALVCAFAATPGHAQSPQKIQTSAAAHSAAFVSPPELATAGYYSLAWRTAGDNATTPHFEIQESTNADFAEFRVVYQGPETATSVSGKADGEYFYRVRVVAATAGDAKARGGDLRAAGWSAVHKVRVQHHPLSRAFAFLLLGGVVFLATAVLILRGNAGASTNPAEGADSKTGGAA